MKPASEGTNKKARRGKCQVDWMREATRTFETQRRELLGKGGKMFMHQCFQRSQIQHNLLAFLLFWRSSSRRIEEEAKDGKFQQDSFARASWSSTHDVLIRWERSFKCLTLNSIEIFEPERTGKIRSRREKEREGKHTEKQHEIVEAKQKQQPADQEKVQLAPIETLDKDCCCWCEKRKSSHLLHHHHHHRLLHDQLQKRIDYSLPDRHPWKRKEIKESKTKIQRSPSQTCSERASTETQKRWAESPRKQERINREMWCLFVAFRLNDWYHQSS